MRCARLVFVILAVIAAGGCTRPATQLLVVVSTDVPGSDYRCVRSHVLRVPSDGEGVSRGHLVPRELELPFSFGVTPPDDDPSRRVQIAVELRGDACDAPSAAESAPVVRRVVRTGFLEGQTLRVPIYLALTCRAVECDPTSTCDPATGACVSIPELAPADLEVVRPGEELSDAAARVDARSSMDAPVLDAPPADAPGLDAPSAPDAMRPDAPGIDATALDAPSSPDAARPDAPSPDAGPGCATMASVTGMLPTSGTLVGYSLTSSPDGASAIRGLAIQRASSDWAGAQDVSSGGGLGSTYYPPPGTSFGPTGVAYNADGSMRIAAFGQSGRFTVMPLIGFSTDAFPGGRCASSRCATRSGATDFAVLTGPTSLTLRQIRVSGRTASTAASIAVASATTNGGVRPSASGVIVSYASGGACFVERWPDFVARTGQVRIDGCVQLDAAELPSGEIGIGWIDSAFAVRAAVINAGHTAVGSSAVLDAMQMQEEPVMVTPTARGFRVSWVEDVGSPMIRSVGLDAALGTLATQCVSSPGDTLEQYRFLGAARRGTGTSVEWPTARDYHGATFPD